MVQGGFRYIAEVSIKSQPVMGCAQGGARTLGEEAPRPSGGHCSQSRRGLVRSRVISARSRLVAVVLVVDSVNRLLARALHQRLVPGRLSRKGKQTPRERCDGPGWWERPDA